MSSQKQTLSEQPYNEAQSSTPIPAHLNPQTYPRTLQDATKNIHLELTYDVLNPTKTLSQISSPSAGANILFVGTTRNSFEGRPVKLLSYTSYAPLALKTLLRIAEDAVSKFGLLGISISHRLGVVPVCEASIVVGISSGHRGPGWRAGEEVLEVVKEKVEIWKKEVFEGRDGDGNGDWNGESEGEGEKGVWRANRDRDAHGRLVLQRIT